MDKAQMFWDKQATRFDDSEKQFEDASLELITRTGEYLEANDNVLDFGCATGSKALKLAGSVRQIHGLDFSAEMIREAIKKKDKLNVANAFFLRGTIYSEVLEKASFEKILAFAVIHLLEDSEKAIQRIHDLLKPGGLFISVTACFKDRMDFKTRLEFTTYRFMRQLGLFPLHMNMFKVSDVERLIKKQNFNIIKTEKLFYNGMTTSFIVAKNIL